jgi:hypothetical protein
MAAQPGRSAGRGHADNEDWELDQQGNCGGGVTTGNVALDIWCLRGRRQRAPIGP